MSVDADLASTAASYAGEHPDRPSTGLIARLLVGAHVNLEVRLNPVPGSEIDRLESIGDQNLRLHGLPPAQMNGDPPDSAYPSASSTRCEASATWSRPVAPEGTGCCRPHRAATPHR